MDLFSTLGELGSVPSPIPKLQTLDDAIKGMKPNLVMSLLEEITSYMQTGQQKMALIRVTDDWVIIGTRSGTIFAFSHDGVLQSTLLMPSHGAVYSILFSETFDLLISGYSDGSILFWTFSKSKVTKEILAVHVKPVTHLSFVSQGDSLRVLSIDTSGNRYIHTIQKRIWMLDVTSEKISFASETFGLASSLSTHSIYACSTSRETFIYKYPSKEPYIWPRPQDIEVGTIPCLVWSYTAVQGTQSKSSILARSWGNHLELFVADDEMVRWLPIFEYKVNSPIRALAWLEDQKLIFLDMSDRLSVFDVAVMDITESVPFGPIDLVGCPVSNIDAMENSFKSNQSAFTALEGKLYLLGTHNVFQVTIPSSVKQIQDCCANNDYITALAIHMSLLKNRSSTPTSLASVKKVMNSLLNHVHDRLGGDAQSMVVAVEACFKITDQVSDHAWLYSDLYGILQSFKQENLFFDELSGFFYSGKITKIPTSIFIEYISYMVSNSRLEKLKHGLKKVNKDLLGQAEILLIIQNKGLFDIYFFHYNFNLKDFLTPVIQLLDASLFNPLTGDPLFQYIQNLFRKQKFTGEPMDNLESCSAIWSEFLGFTFQKSKDMNNFYPMLRWLLMRSIPDTLQIFSSSFDRIGSLQSPMPAPSGNLIRFVCPPLKQIIEAFVYEILGSDSWDFHQKDAVYYFLAPFIAKDPGLLNPTFYHFLLRSLITQSEAQSDKEAHQNLIVSILKPLRLSLYNSEELIQLSEAVSITKVTSLLYKKSGNITHGLLSYLNAESLELKREAFQYIQGEIQESNDSNRETIMGTIEKYFSQLSSIDCFRSLDLLFQEFPLSLENCVTSLESDLKHKIQKFLFMDQLDPLQRRLIYPHISSNKDRIDKLWKMEYISFLFEKEPMRVLFFLQEQLSFDIEATYSLAYSRNNVPVMLYLLKKQNKIKEAFDLSKNELQKKMQGYYQQISTGRASESFFLSTSPTDDILEQLDSVLSLLGEVSNDPATHENIKEYWYDVLGMLRKRLQSSNEEPSEDRINYNDFVMTLIQSTLASMKSFVLISEIANYIIQEFGKENFSRFRMIFQELLTSYSQDRFSYKLMQRIYQNELSASMGLIQNLEGSAIYTKDMHCSVCSRSIALSDSNELIVVSGCGHKCHFSCSKQPFYCTRCEYRPLDYQVVVPLPETFGTSGTSAGGGASDDGSKLFRATTEAELLEEEEDMDEDREGGCNAWKKLFEQVSEGKPSDDSQSDSLNCCPPPFPSALRVRFARDDIISCPPVGEIRFAVMHPA